VRSDVSHLSQRSGERLTTPRIRSQPATDESSRSSGALETSAHQRSETSMAEMITGHRASSETLTGRRTLSIRGERFLVVDRG
jgi:hypothetical protein